MQQLTWSNRTLDFLLDQGVVGVGSQGKKTCATMIVHQTQWPPPQTQWRKKFLQAQEAPSDHGDGACPFKKKNPF